MKVEKLKPIGLCGGVRNAIALALETKEKFPNKNIYIFGMLAHNENIINTLKKKGIETIHFEHSEAKKILNTFNNNDIVIFAAHGHPEIFEEILKNNNVSFVDATCNKIKVMIDIIKNFAGNIIFIGNKKHDETIACCSYSNNIFIYDPTDPLDLNIVPNNNILVLNQTTLSHIEVSSIHKIIKQKIPNAIFSNEICDVVKIRQNLIFSIPETCDLILIIGSKKSSNTTKLFELAKSIHKSKTTFLIENASDLPKIPIHKFSHITLLSGTSTPNYIIDEIENTISNI